MQTFTFDAENRLMSVLTKSPRGEIESRFEYDALGRRIGKTEKTTEGQGARTRQETTRFVWQGLRMVQEINADDVRSYVYSPDAAYVPLARLDVVNVDEVPADFRTTAMLRPRVLHFHTDLVGAPQEVTDKDGELVWAGQYDAWGKVRRGEVTPKIDQPLRFAGQYADEGTGLHYNTFRYYDPDVGRFVSQDPIGVLGGENLYAYAPNSQRWIDPTGFAYQGVSFAGSPDLFPAGAGQSNIVEITMQGTRSRDFVQAYKAAGITKAEAKGYTWHHLDDFNPETGKTTMQLVKTSAHVESFPHAGSADQFAKHFGVEYDSNEAVKVSEQKGWLKGRSPSSC